MSTEKHIYVYADTKDFSEPLFLGMLNSTVVRGKEIFSFESPGDSVPGLIKIILITVSASPQRSWQFYPVYPEASPQGDPPLYLQVRQPAAPERYPL